jgi:predicted peptidase
MGGFGTWALAIAQPTRFAAILPVCGGGDPAKVSVLKDLPIWVVHGDADPIVPISQSQGMVDALKAAGAKDLRFDVLPGIGHDSWTQTYSQDTVYEWFAKQHR